jgi:hypothetical protein
MSTTVTHTRKRNDIHTWKYKKMLHNFRQIWGLYYSASFSKLFWKWTITKLILMWWQLIFWTTKGNNSKVFLYAELSEQWEPLYPLSIKCSWLWQEWTAHFVNFADPEVTYFTPYNIYICMHRCIWLYIYI